jgi:hypothetical protein
MLFLKKEAWRFYLESLYRFTWESTCGGRYISEHAQLKVIEHMFKKERWRP